jgi:ubiquinone/menaquinone biosynthesis C-methylase UbiE
MIINAQYNLARPESAPIKIAKHQRRKMFESFVNHMRPEVRDTILDVGVTTDQSYDHSNYLEAWYPHRSQITAVGIDDAEFLETLYPGVRFTRADARDLPFANNTFDFVHSSAVLEHVGSRQEQTQLLREGWRVSRKGVFVTTPNRWFPIEFHTVLPVLHWLPMRIYRKLLAAMGYKFFADESNLNLISRQSLGKAARDAGIDYFDIASVSLFGFSTNLLLIARKRNCPGP